MPGLILEQYAVSRNAFLPESWPAGCLADQQYRPWEFIGSKLPELISECRIHAEIDKMPLIDTERLDGLSEWRRAYVLLAFMTHAYVWAGKAPREVLPPQITIPFLSVSKHLELPPVLTYAATSLWNFTPVNTKNGPSDLSYSDLSDPSRLKPLISFTGTRDEAWFFLISVAIEARGATIVETVLTSLEGVKKRDYAAIIDGLERLKECIVEIGDLLERIYEGCDPWVFFYQVRPYLSGSYNMAAAGLPRGLRYDEGDSKGEWQQLRGGSNGQSSLIPLFDLALGIVHESNGTGSATPGQNELEPCRKSFHEQIREYMPGPHARFLEHVASMGSIRNLLLDLSKTGHGTDVERTLRARYVAATDALAELRGKHIQIVTRYIIVPSQKQRATIKSEGSLHLTGTGGTALLPFLKQTRDETKNSGHSGFAKFGNQ